MDIEQLKLILDIIKDTSNSALWIAIAWIAKGYFTSIMWFMFGLITLRYAFILATQDSFEYLLSKTMNSSYRGLSGPEKSKVLKAVNDLKKGES